jgi:hypothetical protein
MLVGKNQEGSISVIVAVLMSLLFISASVFGLWAFTQSQTYKNDVDAIVEDEVALAVQAAKTAKDAEFVEIQKSPTKTFTSSSTYGSLKFSYPKTWSLYNEDGSSGTEFSLYGHPNIVHDTSNGVPFALTVQVVSKSYDTVLESFSRNIESGSVIAKAFRPEKVKNVLGSRLSGEIDRDVTGTTIVLPLRDKTIVFTTQSTEYLSDFNNIILPSISYAP